MPLGLGCAESARWTIVKLSSITEPRIYELMPEKHDVVLVRLALKHAFLILLRYLDELGRELESELVPVKEENEFFVCVVS